MCFGKKHTFSLKFYFTLAGCSMAMGINTTGTQSCKGTLEIQWNCMDSSGIKNHGAVVNSIQFNQNGITNQPTSAYFNGYNSSVVVPHNPLFNLAQFSICTTVKPTGSYAGKCQGNRIFNKTNDISPAHYSYYLRTESEMHFQKRFNKL